MGKRVRGYIALVFLALLYNEAISNVIKKIEQAIFIK